MLSERLAYILTLDADQAVRGFQKVGNTADKELAKAETSGERLASGFKKHAAAAAAFLGVAGAAMFDLAKSASDVEEASAAAGQIFGANSATIVRWAEKAAASMGMSKVAALDAANTVAIFGKSAGLAGAELVTFSTEMVELAGDLASFKNTSPEEAIEAIGAALRGESEPIRKYGVLLDDATLKHRAMSMGIYDGIGALSAQQKVLAAQAEILAQTSDAQGDFARTSDSMANQMRKAGAELENLKAKLGAAFLPAVAQTIKFLTGVVTGVERVHDAVNDFENDIESALGAKISASISPAVQAIEDLGDAADRAAPRMDALATAAGNIPSMEGPFSNDLAGLEAMADAYRDAGKAAEILGGTLVVNGEVIASLEGPYAMTAAEALRLEQIMSGDLPTAFEKVEARAKENASANKLVADAAKDAEQAAKEHADALLEEADALLEASGAMRDTADIAMDLQDAQAEVMRTAGDADATLNDLARSVSRAADLETDLYEATIMASGGTMSHTQRLDANNSSLLKQASQLQGPQRRAILDYIGQINGIPSERISEIEALLNRGSVSEAEGVLRTTSRARESTITADANTAAAEAELNRVARDRKSTVRIITVGGAQTVSTGRGNNVGMAEGGRARGGVTLVGEEGPELVKMPAGATVYPADETARMLNGGARSLGGGVGGGGTRVVNVTIHTGADPKAVVDAIKKYERFNGPGWRPQ